MKLEGTCVQQLLCCTCLTAALHIMQRPSYLPITNEGVKVEWITIASGGQGKACCLKVSCWSEAHKRVSDDHVADAFCDCHFRSVIAWKSYVLHTWHMCRKQCHSCNIAGPFGQQALHGPSKEHRRCIFLAAKALLHELHGHEHYTSLNTAVHGAWQAGHA